MRVGRFCPVAFRLPLLIVPHADLKCNVKNVVIVIIQKYPKFRRFWAFTFFSSKIRLLR